MLPAIPIAKAENYQNCNNPSRITLTVARLEMADLCGFAHDRTASCSAVLGLSSFQSWAWQWWSSGGLRSCMMKFICGAPKESGGIIGGLENRYISKAYVIQCDAFALRFL
jgi:hypothetical protein